MVELRPRRARAAAEAALAEGTPKPKTPKSSKRKATEDVSPTATKKTKSAKTPSKSKDAEEPVKQEVDPTAKAKKSKTPIKAKDTVDAVVEETEKTSASKSKKTPTKSKAVGNATPKEVEKTPGTKVEKTPASKAKKEKTPTKAKLVKDPPSKEAEQPTPKTTEKKSEGTEVTLKDLKVAGKTPISKAKAEAGNKTPKSTNRPTKGAPESVEDKEDTTAETEKEGVVAEEDGQSFSDEELDEQTKALVRTIDNEDEDDEGPGSGVILFEKGQDVGKIPVTSAASKKEKKAAKKALSALKHKEEPGVIYIGRLPHGFYEHEMKSYFSQFGPIRNLRVARNKKTGKPKHFAFIEFEETSTAEIVAKTMDNYLLFGHILKCSVVPKAQVHEELFKGANKRFKPVPWNKMQGKQMERPMLEDKWARKAAKENKRRAERAKKMQSLGYEFSAPEVKTTGPTKAIAAPETEEEEITKVIQEATTEALAVAPEAKAANPVAGEETEEAEATPKPAKRGRGRPAKTPQKKATVTPRKTRGKA